MDGTHTDGRQLESMSVAFKAPDARIGRGVATTVGDVLERAGVTDPLVVTDEGIEAAGLLGPIVDAIDADATVHYATTEPAVADFENLPTETVDGVVAIGGGSCMDTAKVVATLLAHGGDAADYLGVDAVPGPVASLIAIPTTSGTGSQATQTAVVSHDGVKRGISDEHLRPDYALVDPSLTSDLPSAQTARSGFDAFVHALESLTARDYRWVESRPITYQGANPASRALAREALLQVHDSLERATFDGDDRDAREAMSVGSHLAGTAFSISGLGIVHAIASTLGGLTNDPHGACLAASIEAGLTYNLPVRRAEYADVARTLEVVDAGASDREAATALIAECGRLRTSLNLPTGMAALGLGPEDVDTIVENTLIQERRLPTNPRAAGEDLGEHLLEIEFDG
ncbi:iron-containing alcohol dehydrogenase [Salinadaptatus halalkaliphilus]|uniref:Iron-containing alcohol dehydrogenase n=1 Tax=Salinadaptatus halalkaliphilus TaxID=2419781 RepID=A0A4S3TJ73_9EURY|nr:iron-containing alcohol dehydrogenase [Salinadaptatus halalkaliphilus]THE64119.1 iron-containing alcohol dehydrogenase [Salinadaptatus halalkaliphilus]